MMLKNILNIEITRTINTPGSKIEVHTATYAKILQGYEKELSAQAERIVELEELCDHYVPKNQGFQDFNCTQCETTWKGEIESVCPVCNSED